MSFAYFKSKPSNSMYYVLRYLQERTLANRKRNQANTSVCVSFFDRHLIMNIFSASADHSASFRTYIEAAIAASLLATLVLLRSKASHNSEPPSNNTEATLKVILKTKVF